MRTAVVDIVAELYAFLRQPDAREPGDLFRQIDAARARGDRETETLLIDRVDGHQDGKVTVPHEDFPAKIRLPARLPGARRGGGHHRRPHRLAGRRLDQADRRQPHAGRPRRPVQRVPRLRGGRRGRVRRRRRAAEPGGRARRVKRLPSNLFQFRADTGADRCVLDSITSPQNGADLIWIETERPHVEQIASMMDRVRAVVPDGKLVYNNSPSFNWTLNFRQQAFAAWSEDGRDVTAYDRPRLMGTEYDATPLALEADQRIRTFQADASRRAGIFRHLITLPTYHTAALSTDALARDYFGTEGMLGYVLGLQREELRRGIACVRHQFG